MENNNQIQVVEPNQAVLNITYRGSNGNLREPIGFMSSDGDVKQIATEAVRTGYIDGIPADLNVDFRDFVVERFTATAELPNRIFLRPKTEFGG